MKSLGFSALALSLLIGCDKTVPFENTAPAKTTPVIPTGPSIDASIFRSLDAQVSEVSDGAMPETPPFTTTLDLLKAIADCSLARYREFNDKASALAAATAAWAASPTDALRQQAQLAWLAAMASWQVNELFRFGPSGAASEPGGKDYRNAIYFFPSINLCLVDQQLVNTSYTKGVTNLSVGARGLGALEYLLFYNGPSNSCSSAVVINTGTPSPWSQLAPTDLTARRAAFAGALGQDLALTAKTLLDAWDPLVGNFYAQLSEAGTSGSTTFKTDQDAFNAIDMALFYVDKELKDDKLATPLGLSMDCTTGTCPQFVESRFAGVSDANISENLAGFRDLIQGCGPGHSGLGFDDYLIKVNHADLASRLLAATDEAERAAAALTLPLDQLVTADRNQGIALHTAVRNVGALLKTEVVSALNLELPAMAVGDND